MQILTAAQMRDAEAALIAGGDTVDSLMDRAGRGAAEYVFRVAAGRSVTVLCGPGNNGGDGYVIARVLHERGVPVVIVAPQKPKTAAAQAARAQYRGEFADAAHGAVLVDCLFGTGLTRALDPELAALLAGLAARHSCLIAIDLPSGVDADCGVPLGDGLPDYHLTLALGAWKWAHWRTPAAMAMGEMRLIEIGIGAMAGAGRASPVPRVAAPAADSHKYSRGLLAVVGGEMPGAARLAARAALHGGAGYVKLVAEQALRDDLVVVSSPLPEALADKRIAAVLIGPGLGRGEQALVWLQHSLAGRVPTVLDADALLLLQPDMIDRGQTLILTPHAGELAALFARFAVDPADKVAALRQLASAVGAIVVAKGPNTLVASPDGEIVAMPRASSWLSTAGTGDVLAGLIASRLATGIEPLDAAVQGGWLHAEAARLAGPAFSASTLIDHIPEAYANFL